MLASRFILSGRNVVGQIHKMSLNTSQVFFNNITYAKTGEWISNIDNENKIKIGLSMESIENLSEIVYLEAMIEEGGSAKCDDEIILVESVKATAAIIAPFDGAIVKINSDLFEDLDQLNKDPENIEKSWLVEFEKNDK
jgi:glycine cleavage system H lipoate-binding protein